MATGNIKGIKIELDGDTTGLQQALKKVDGETKNVQNELRQVDKLLKFDPSNVELLSQKQKLLGDAIDGTSKRLDALKQAQSEVERQFQNGEIGEEAYRKFQREIIATEGKLKAFQSQADSVKVKIDAQTDLSGLDKMTKKLEEVGEKAKEVGGKMKDVGTEMSTKLTAPLAAFGGGALIAAGQFNNAAGQIQAALGVTADEAEALEEQAKSVWRAGFGESLEEVSNALVRVKQNMQGVSDGDELEKVTRDALALAKTFDSDVNEVTRAGNNLMTNFGISSEEAFDMMTKGAQNGLNFSNEMFDNLAEYAPLFADLGFSADEMFGTLISGSQEGVYNLDYLNDMVKEFGIRLMDGSEKTQKAMSGIFSPEGFFDFAENLKKYGKDSSEYLEVVAIMGEDYTNNIIESMRKGGREGGKAWESLEFNMGRGREIIDGITDGSISGQEAMKEIAQALLQIEDPVAQTALGVELFGTKFEDLGTDASLAMLSAGKSLEDFEGSMDSLAKTQEQTFGQRWESFTRTAAASLEPIGKVLLDLAEQWLPRVIAVVESLATWFSNLSPVMQGLIVIIGAIVAAIGPLLVVVGLIVSAIGNIIPVITTLMPIIKAAGVAIAGLSAPVAIAIAAVTALIAIGVLLYKNWDEVSAFLKRTWESIKSIASTTFKAIESAIAAAWKAIKSATESVWNSIKTFFSTVWNAIKNVFDTVVKSIQSQLDKYWSSMGDGIKKVWDGIKQYFSSVWDLIKNVFVGGLLVILQLLTGQWGEAKKSTEQIWNNIKKALSGIWDALEKVFSGALDAITGYVKTSWDNLKNTTTSVFNSVKSAISSAWDNIKSSTNNTASSIVSTVTSKFNDIVGSVRSKMGEVLSTVKNIWGNVQSFFSGIDLYSIGRDIISGLIRGIKNMTSQAIEAVTGVVDGVINKAKNLLGIKSPSRVFMEIGHDTNAGFIEGIKDNNNKLQKTVGNVYGSLASSAQKSAEVSTSNIKNTTSTIDNSKYMQPQIHITVQGGNMSPSEIARKALQTQRQLAMEWGV
ncbi:MAG: phage tail tape measure protein [Solibacillus sp.]